jgi:hypothetical protein
LLAAAHLVSIQLESLAACNASHRIFVEALFED